MSKKRQGYSQLPFELPTVILEALKEEAAVLGVSATQLLTEMLRQHYRIARDKIPPRKRPGRKPRK